jgi:hypothetical protein
MKLRISPTILDEMGPAMEDAMGRVSKNNTLESCDPTDKTYLKIVNAEAASKRGKCVIEADADDIHEIRSRADYVLTCLIPDNMDWAKGSDRIFYMNLSRAYQGLLKQIAEDFNPPTEPPSTKEKSMTTRITLSKTQYDILEHAIDHNDGQIAWFPDNVKGGARHKVIQGLLNKALITRKGNDNWSVTAEGYVALGRDMPAPTALHPDPEMVAAVAPDRPRTRATSKQAAVIRMLQRPEGATIAQICSATGWQAHTVRGTFAGAFKKKLGFNLTSDKPDGGERTYRLCGAPHKTTRTAPEVGSALAP